MNSIPPHRPEHRYEETSLLAYHLWQQANCPPGEDLKFWLQAEQQLFGKQEAQRSPQQKAAAGHKTAGNGRAQGNGKAGAKRAASATATAAGTQTATRSAAKATRQAARAQ